MSGSSLLNFTLLLKFCVNCSLLVIKTYVKPDIGPSACAQAPSALTLTGFSAKGQPAWYWAIAQGPGGSLNLRATKEAVLSVCHHIALEPPEEGEGARVRWGSAKTKCR